MKKLIYLYLALFIVACSTDDNNNVDEVEWLLVHTATEATATNSTTLVMPLTNDIFAFTDRPYRDYLYLDGEDLLQTEPSASRALCTRGAKCLKRRCTSSPKRRYSTDTSRLQNRRRTRVS